MLLKHVKIGDRLEISNAVRTDGEKFYTSQVEDIDKDGKIIIHMPISLGQLIKLPQNKEYRFLFFTDSGIIQYNAVIYGHKLQDGFNLTEIKLTSEGERLQRREYFRFTCMIPTKFSVQEKDGNADNNIVTFEGIIKDIGGGGLRFVSNEILDEKKEVRAAIILDDDVLIVSGRILQKQIFPKSNYRYQYRVEFIGILKSEQEIIIQYIFDQQRKILQRTKI